MTISYNRFFLNHNSDNITHKTTSSTASAGSLTFFFGGEGLNVGNSGIGGISVLRCHGKLLYQPYLANIINGYEMEWP